MPELYCRIEGKGDTVYQIVGFTGGDWQHYAVVEDGRKLRPVPLEEVRLVTRGERQQWATNRALAEAGY